MRGKNWLKQRLGFCANAGNGEDKASDQHGNGRGNRHFPGFLFIDAGVKRSDVRDVLLRAVGEGRVQDGAYSQRKQNQAQWQKPTFHAETLAQGIGARPLAL